MFNWYRLAQAQEAIPIADKLVQDELTLEEIQEYLAYLGEMRKELFNLTGLPLSESDKMPGKQIKTMLEQARRERMGPSQNVLPQTTAKEFYLTPQQQHYINSITNDVVAYIQDVFRKRMQMGYINPNFILDEDTMQDVAQEGIIKAMEVVLHYWGQKETPPNLHSLWNAIEVSLRRMVVRLTQSAQPNIHSKTEEDVNSYNRQYITMREKVYHHPNKEVVKFLDKKIIEEFGDAIFANSNPQEISEIVTYITNQYREDIKNILLAEGIEVTHERLEKEIKRYRGRLVVGHGGQTQTELRGDIENLSDDELLSIIGFESLPEETLEQLVERKKLSQNIKTALTEFPSTVRLAIVLFYNLDLREFGFGQIIDVGLQDRVLTSVSASHGDAKWESVKNILPLLVKNFNRTKVGQKLRRLDARQFRKMISQIILNHLSFS